MDITLNGAQGDLINIEAFADGYCRANDSNGPGGSDTREINCDDTETLTLVTTPVTLSAVSSERSGDKVKVDWSTSSELFNVGYQLWGLDAADSKWHKLHSWLVRSGSGNAVEAQSYSKSLKVPGSINELIALGISSVDSNGAEHYYGPFDVGQAYGNLSTLKPIAWDHIRDQVDTQMAARGYVKDRLYGYRKTAASRTADSGSVIEFKVRDAGMYRITASQLSSAGMDWGSVARRDIALLDDAGNAVVRHVAAKGDGSGQAKALGSNGEIYFHGRGVDPRLGLYSETRVYRLVIDRTRALNAPYQGKRGLSGGFSEYYRAETVLERDSQYSLTSAADDPWLDAVVLSYPEPHQTGAYAAGLPVEADALWDKASVLTLGLGRSSGLAPVDGDGDGIVDAEHRVEAMVLSADGGAGGLLSLGIEQASGSGEWVLDFTIPGNTPLTLLDGKAVVGGIFSAGEGYAFSEVHVDSIGLSYARPYVAKSGEDYLAFEAPADGAPGYEVTVPDSGWPQVFAYAQGNLVRLALESQEKQTAASGGQQRVVRFAALDGAQGSATPVNYWVSGKGGLLDVEGLSAKTVASRPSLLTQAAGADLLIVAHPAFMTPALSGYAQFKRSQGYGVSVIDYLEIVDAFGGGQAGPDGLTRYLREVEAQGNIDHVLLVGGSSYDHTDRLGTGAMTFIPGHYGESSYSNYTVTDTPYITDSGNRLFAGMGRWPVRSGEDLEHIIASSMAWSNRDRTQGSALAIAEHTVAGEGIDFGAALDGVVSQLPAGLITSRVYVDEVLATHPDLSLPQALAQVRGQIIDGLNASPDIVLYNGHATTSQLSNKGLFRAGDVGQLSGDGGGQMWLPMSCYMTYYESTHVNTLAHQLLFSGDAVGISGAMLLSNQGSNIAAGTAIVNSTLNTAASIGEAVNAHKAAQSNPKLNINLSHLGDPTLKM